MNMKDTTETDKVKVERRREVNGFLHRYASVLVINHMLVQPTIDFGDTRSKKYPANSQIGPMTLRLVTHLDGVPERARAGRLESKFLSPRDILRPVKI